MSASKTHQNVWCPKTNPHYRPSRAPKGAKGKPGRKKRSETGNKCVMGHLVLGENAYTNPTTGKQACRECNRAAWRRYDKKRRQRLQEAELREVIVQSGGDNDNAEDALAGSLQ